MDSPVLTRFEIASEQNFADSDNGSVGFLSTLSEYADGVVDEALEHPVEALGYSAMTVCTVVGARFLAPKIIPILPRLEIASFRLAASQSTKIGEVELQLCNGALTKIRFPDGGRAWRTGKYWRETFPDGSVFEGRIKPVSPQFRVESGNLIRETSSETTTFRPDGLVDTAIKPEVFSARGEVSEEIIKKYRDAYLRLPEGLRNLFAYDGRIVIGRTLKEAAPELKNVTPAAQRPGVTYDHILGVAQTKSDHYRIVLPEKVRPYPVNVSSEFVTVGFPERTLRHEVGHVIDYDRGMLSSGPRFVKAYNRDLKENVSLLSESEKDRLWYFLDGAEAGAAIAERRRSETFAELFAEIYRDAKPRPSLFTRVLNGFRPEDNSKLPLIMRAFPNSRYQIERDLRRFTLV